MTFTNSVIIQVDKKIISECGHDLRGKMDKKSQQNVKWISITPSKPPNRAQPEKIFSLIVSCKCGCTYVYKVIPIVPCISDIYQSIHNITKMFIEGKCYIGVIDLTIKFKCKHLQRAIIC